MKKISKKLAFSATTVRQLQQSMSEEDLQGVAGGTLQTGGPTGGGGGGGGPLTGGGASPTTLLTRSISGVSKECPQAC